MSPTPTASRRRSWAPSRRPFPRPRSASASQRVYGGVAVELPANQIAKVLAIPGVAAVQQDSLEQPLTDSSTTFIGAPTIWDQLDGGQPDAGKGLIFGSLDTGVWPEHPSFADNGDAAGAAAEGGRHGAGLRLR